MLEKLNFVSIGFVTWALLVIDGQQTFQKTIEVARFASPVG